MSALSYKASNDKLEKQELEELKRKVDSFKNSKEDFEKEVTILIQKTIEIVDKITNDIKKLKYRLL